MGLFNSIQQEVNACKEGLIKALGTEIWANRGDVWKIPGDNIV